MKLNKRAIFNMLLAVWIALWINFIMRDLYMRGYLADYKALVTRDAEGKRSYTYGNHFYEFLKIAKEEMPEGSYYDFEGVEEFSLASRRAIYYLYPCLRRKNPDYILDYDEKKIILKRRR